MTLEKIIETLINTRKEGDYWDFKREKHKDKAEFVHDIICLANSPYHTGDRFLVFGVENNYTILGIEPKEKQTQVKIICRRCFSRYSVGNNPIKQQKHRSTHY